MAMKFLDFDNWLFENETSVPEIVFHGSGHTIDLNSLQLDRSSLNIDKKGTGSEKGGYGFYITKALWEDGRNTDTRIVSDVYQEGNTGNQSAEKYASWAFDKTKKAFIYQVRLSKNINLKYDNNPNVSKEEYEQYIKEGYDGLINQNEGVLFKKEKIESITLVYYAEDFMIQVVPYDKGKFDYSRTKIIPKDKLQAILKQNLGENYVLVKKDFKPGWNLYWDNRDNAQKAVAISRYVILDWKKIK